MIDDLYIEEWDNGACVRALFWNSILYKLSLKQYISRLFISFLKRFYLRFKNKLGLMKLIDRGLQLKS